MKRSVLVVLAIFTLAASALADSVTVQALGPMKTSNGSNPPGVFLFSVGGHQMLAFPDETPSAPIAGQSWTATAIPFANFAQASFGSDTDALHDYEAAAWLIQQEPGGGSANTMDIQMAVLAVFNPSIEKTKPWNEGASMWLAKAEGNTYTLSEFSGFQILVPKNCLTAGCSALELLVPPSDSPGPSTPEPASMALFGLGILALATMLRKRVFAAKN